MGELGLFRRASRRSTQCGGCCGPIPAPFVDYGFRTFAVVASNFESKMTHAEQALEYLLALGEQDNDDESSSGDDGLDSSEELELEASSSDAGCASDVDDRSNDEDGAER